jgi:anti-anti-sigma regulatory factor
MFYFLYFQQLVVLATETTVAAITLGKRPTQILIFTLKFLINFSFNFFVISESTRRTFESPAPTSRTAATATIAAPSDNNDDDTELTMANRNLPKRRVQAIAVATPQATPIVVERRTKKSSITVTVDDNAANSTRSREVGSPVVSRKRVFDASAAATAAAAAPVNNRPAPITKRSRAHAEPIDQYQAHLQQQKQQQKQQQQQQQQLAGNLRLKLHNSTHIDTVCAIMLEAAQNQARKSGNRPWITQFHNEVTDEFELLHAKVDTHIALGRRVRQMHSDIDSARLGAVEAARERATIDEQLRAETNECDARRAAVDRKTQLSSWLRQMQAVKTQAAGATRDRLTHVVVPNEALDLVRTTRNTRLLAARLRAARAVGEQSDAAIASLTRNSSK